MSHVDQSHFGIIPRITPFICATYPSRVPKSVVRVIKDDMESNDIPECRDYHARSSGVENKNTGRPFLAKRASPNPSPKTLVNGPAFSQPVLVEDNLAS